MDRQDNALNTHNSCRDVRSEKVRVGKVVKVLNSRCLVNIQARARKRQTAGCVRVERCGEGSLDRACVRKKSIVRLSVCRRTIVSGVRRASSVRVGVRANCQKLKKEGHTYYLDRSNLLTTGI